MTMTKGELVKAIIKAAEDMDDGLNCQGFDMQEASGRYESLTRELAERFGQAVGHGGVLYSV